MRTMPWDTWQPRMAKMFRTASGNAAAVVYPLSGDGVEHDDGTRAPKQFAYIEQPTNDSDPYYIVECEHTGPDLAPRAIAVHIIARDEAREVRATDLRNVKVEEAIEDAARYCFQLPASSRVDGKTPDDLFADDPERALMRTIRGLRQKGRRRLGTELLEEVARIYRENRASGTPAKAVREELDLPSSTASHYIRRAREVGMDMGDLPGEDVN